MTGAQNLGTHEFIGHHQRTLIGTGTQYVLAIVNCLVGVQTVEEALTVCHIVVLQETGNTCSIPY
jgi:hypothetical protein